MCCPLAAANFRLLRQTLLRGSQETLKFMALPAETKPDEPWAIDQNTHQLPLSLGERRCLLYLEWAFQEIKAEISPGHLQAMTQLIVKAMTGPSRYFHNLDHAFDVAQSGDAIEVLAALFHDVVYVQIDDGISVELAESLAPFIETLRERLVIRDLEENLADQSFVLVMTIFDVQLGQHLALEQNEFLSALIAAKQLESILNKTQLAEIIACIEATIPFRPPTIDGLQPSENLYRKLSSANDRFQLAWDEIALVRAVQRAVRVGNRDVENFADLQAADFLSNTWNLLPESNPCLRAAEDYTIQQYRHVLEKTTSFMYYLNAPLVFRQFEGEPSVVDYEGLLERTNKNLVVARLYLSIKLLAIAILEALTYRSHPLLPLGCLGGVNFSEISSQVMQRQSVSISDVPYHPRDCIEQEIWTLLQVGRSQESSFDIKNSPIAAFLLKHLGLDQMVARVDRGKAFFQEKITAEEFLAEFDPGMIAIFQKMLSQAVERDQQEMLPPFDERNIRIAG